MASYIRYEALRQAAMRGVMREALRVVAKNGLVPGDHHFYINFKTRAPGVKIADFLIQRFPEEMTIVIQHQFWDLEVGDDGFEVVLKFGGVPQHLEIPYTAVTRFIDPSENFALVFDKGYADSGTLTLSDDEQGEGGIGAATETANADGEANTVVNLDSFRKR